MLSRIRIKWRLERLLVCTNMVLNHFNFPVSKQNFMLRFGSKRLIIINHCSYLTNTFTGRNVLILVLVLVPRSASVTRVAAPARSLRASVMVARWRGVGLIDSSPAPHRTAPHRAPPPGHLTPRRAIVHSTSYTIIWCTVNTYIAMVVKCDISRTTPPTPLRYISSESVALVALYFSSTTTVSHINCPLVNIAFSTKRYLQTLVFHHC